MCAVNNFMGIHHMLDGLWSLFRCMYGILAQGFSQPFMLALGIYLECL